MAESIYTELNDEGIPIRNIVITKKMLATGLWGDPKKWVKGPQLIPDPTLDPTGKIIAPENKVALDGKL